MGLWKIHTQDNMKLMDDLAVLRPTIFCSVPRLYNRIYAGYISNSVLSRIWHLVCLLWHHWIEWFSSAAFSVLSKHLVVWERGYLMRPTMPKSKQYCMVKFSNNDSHIACYKHKYICFLSIFTMLFDSFCVLRNDPDDTLTRIMPCQVCIDISFIYN